MKTVPTCRACGAADLRCVLDLGPMPLANALLTEVDLAAEERRFPLTLVLCPRCALVQIAETVPPAEMFCHYLYLSSFSDTAVREAGLLAERMIAERGLDERSLVVELASNDGYLLQHYQRRGVPVLGVEPAANIARIASEERGIPTLAEFFTRALGESLQSSGQRASLLHANNVLAHVPDLDGFVGGIEEVLEDDGLAVIEVPHVTELVDGCEFDTVYHEHLCYFSLTALQALFARHGLTVCSVERLAIHGGSLRLFAGKAGRVAPDASVGELLRWEDAWGVSGESVYRTFAARVAEARRALRELLGERIASGRTIAAYGASAKGCVLLNHCDLGRSVVSYVVDKSPHKQGLYMPGVRIPIAPPSQLLADMPHDVLVLVRNLTSEVLAQQAEYRRRGGRFIVPLPVATELS